MGDAPRYATLQDYVRVLRRRWRLIALITAVTGSIALAVSLTQTPTYEASVQLSFRDIVEDLDLIGGGQGVPDEQPQQRAATNAERITRPEVTRVVARRLDTDLSTTELQNSVSTRVGLQTALVILTAQATNGELAADIANEYARATQEVVTKEEQDRLALLQESAERELQEARERPRSEREPFEIANAAGRVSRLRTLGDIAEPVEIATRAEIPDSPVSPQPVRDTALGMMLGAIFGILAAFLRDSLDRRLHGAHDAHEELGVPVLGRVSEGALGYPGLAVNGRLSMAENDFEAFRVLRTNLGFLSKETEIRTLLVTSGLPEEGKSTVSMSLASACVIAGQRVLLIECDLRRPSFGRRLGIEGTPGLTDYLLGSAAPRDVLQTVELVEPSSWTTAKDATATAAAGTLVCVAAGSPASRPAELLVTERFHALLGTVRKAYDMVILDGSPLLSVVDPLELVAQVDGLLICVRAGRTTRDELRAARAALSNLPERPTGAVVTGMRRGGPDSYEYYYGY